MPRYPLPRLWLMTDERIGDALWPALARLPRGSGVVFRHYRLRPSERRALFERVRGVARRRRLVLLLAGSLTEAVAWRADGAHGGNPHRRAVRPLIRTAPAHDARELVAARRAGADAAFLSPLYPTRSHPDAGPLGVARFARLARGAGLPIIALGGMTPVRARHVARLGAHGWAAIDAWCTQSYRSQSQLGASQR